MNVRNIGSVLDGKYQILSRLGSGGMGEVYRVRHLHLDELRVIKVLRQDLAGDTTVAKRFLQEARTATQIKHPNVAILYDFSQLADGSFYMVWEHIDGQDVGTWLRDRGPFPARLAVQLAAQALHGLDAIHGAGVIHRDISPDNLMITRDAKGRYQVKIIDLGLAKALEADGTSDLTEEGSFLGKMRYCSPEQAEEDAPDLDQRSDIYSLAVVLYEMICGRPPFDSESPHGLLIKRLTEDPLPLTGRNPEVMVPETLDRVVLKGLEKSRERRYPSAQAFLAELERTAELLRRSAETVRPAAKPAGDAVRQELSKEEKSSLLAQINAAARRAKSGTRLLAQADAAVDEGQLDRARELVAKIEESEPRLEGLAALRQRIDGAEKRESERRRVTEAEQMVEGYLKQRKAALARFALQALLEIAPEHPRRDDYENWVRLLDEEERQQKRAEEAFEAGRKAARAGDWATARRQLVLVEDNDLSGDLGGRLAAEIESGEKGRAQSAEVAEIRARLDQCLGDRNPAGANRELAALTGLDVARVTLQDYRRRIEELQGSLDDAADAQRLVELFREKLTAGELSQAKEVAERFSEHHPGDRRGGDFRAEVARLEDRQRKNQALEAGIRQLEQLLDAGELRQAELALRIVVQMGPDHPRRRELEDRLQALRG